MSEVMLDKEELISTSKASELSKYTQDYIGQLCRAGSLKCKMISDQWYIDPISLKRYIPGVPESNEADDDVQHSLENSSNLNETEEKPKYSVKIGDVRSGAFKYDGEEYIPTQKAAEITGYTQDYVGQLARGGEIAARKVGRRWYVGKAALLQHRTQKDSMLRAVQSDASGVESSDDAKGTSTENGSAARKVRINLNFDIKYLNEHGKPLLPSSLIGIEHSEIGPNTDTDRKPQDPTSLGRFHTITTPQTVNKPVNTRLGYTRTPVMADDIKLTNKNEVVSNSTKIVTGSKNIKSSSMSLTAPIGIFVILMVFGLLLYLTASRATILKPLRPIYNTIQLLENTYGAYIPGKILQYSN